MRIFLGIVGAAMIVLVIIKGIITISRWKTRNEFMTELAKRELRSGETLLCCESLIIYIMASLWSLTGGLCCFVGIVFLISEAYLQSDLTYVIWSVILLPISLFLFIPGFKRFITTPKEYFFVTNKRLCIRRKGWFGNNKDRDIPAESVHNAYKLVVTSRSRASIEHTYLNVQIDYEKDIRLPMYEEPRIEAAAKAIQTMRRSY